MIDARGILRLLVLIFIQVSVLNKVDFFGFANPMIFLLFYMLFPYQESKTSLLLIGFFNGLVIDIFCDTGGIFAGCTLFVVFVRPVFIRLFFGQNFDYQTINLFQIALLPRISYIFFISFSFHLLFFLLELFNFEQWFYALHKVLISSVLTMLVCVLTLNLFSYQKR